MSIEVKLINEAKRIEEDTLFSAKGHFCAARGWTNIHLWLGGSSAILAAIAGASALSKFDYHNIIAGVLSIIVATATALITFLNPSKRASIHQESGNKYKALRNNARIFYDIEINTLDEKNNAENLKKLNDQRNKLNLESPQIPRWAFKKARKGIEDGEAEYKVDIKN